MVQLGHQVRDSDSAARSARMSGASPVMLSLFRSMDKNAGIDVPVLL